MCKYEGLCAIKTGISATIDFYAQQKRARSYSPELGYSLRSEYIAAFHRALDDRDLRYGPSKATPRATSLIGIYGSFIGYRILSLALMGIFG